jgi:CheY-like chemotaxis protein
MAYQIVLEDAGYECVSYTDSVKSLQEFRPAYYDLILLDIKMPILNAFELCKKILDNTSQTASITASKEYNENFRKNIILSCLIMLYIQKPISNDETIQIVNTMSGSTTALQMHRIACIVTNEEYTTNIRIRQIFIPRIQV